MPGVGGVAFVGMQAGGGGVDAIRVLAYCVRGRRLPYRRGDKGICRLGLKFAKFGKIVNTQKRCVGFGCLGVGPNPPTWTQT